MEQARKAAPQKFVCGGAFLGSRVAQNPKYGLDEGDDKAGGKMRKELTLGNILEALISSHDCGLLMKSLDLKACPGT